MMFLTGSYQHGSRKLLAYYRCNDIVSRFNKLIKDRIVNNLPRSIYFCPFLFFVSKNRTLVYYMLSSCMVAAVKEYLHQYSSYVFFLIFFGGWSRGGGAKELFSKMRVCVYLHQYTTSVRPYRRVCFKLRLHLSKCFLPLSVFQR